MFVMFIVHLEYICCVYLQLSQLRSKPTWKVYTVSIHINCMLYIHIVYSIYVYMYV